MLKVLALCAAGSLGLAVLAAAASAQGQPPRNPPPPPMSADLKVGDMAPDFALQGSDGKVHKLSEYKGRTVVLAWFPKAFTGG
ncbi:MAG: redoxin domain-containing protein [Acidobacteria bacterium]|nr:redoxin domain-containing protein [Acidobacteriota bacterium]